MDMADGNFVTNQKMLGKKNGSKHVDRIDKIVFPLDRPPDLGSLFTSLHYLLIRLKPRKFILNIGQSKSISLGSTSISLYGLWALNNLSQRYAIPIPTIGNCTLVQPSARYGIRIYPNT